MNFKNKSTKTGFTLIELLVVIGILTILLSIVLIAINPNRQFSQANNVQRRSDVQAILNAIYHYSADNKGNLSAMSLPSTATNIGSGTGDIDICSLIVPTYVAEMPYDPTATGASYTDCSSYDTGYTVVANTTGGNTRITVAAPSAELSQSISITR